MEVGLAVAADYASVSVEGKLNILGVFDVLNAPALPLTLPQFFIVLVLTMGREEVNRQTHIRVQLVDQDGIEVASIEGGLMTPANLPDGRQQASVNQLIGLAGLTFHRSGDHRIRIYVDGLEQRPLHLYVTDQSEATNDA